jgi:hypothetical protein
MRTDVMSELKGLRLHGTAWHRRGVSWRPKAMVLAPRVRHQTL